jgi:RecJ-like exonuclease
MTQKTGRRLDAEARKISEKILASDSVIVASHIDADGISAAAIASSALDRAGKEHEVIFLKKLDEESIADLERKAEKATVWLTDLGSGYASKFSSPNVVITDHHEMEEKPQNENASAQTTLASYSGPAHINPAFFGHAGAKEISGAGLAYYVAIEMGRENERLVDLPVIGAIGDMQDQESRRLIGLNAKLVDAGVKLGIVKRTRDLRFFGTETRTLPRLLEYANDPFLPGLTGDSYGCDEFYRMLKIDTEGPEGPRHWSDLSESERHRVLTALSRRILEGGGSEREVERLSGEVYTFPKERKGSPTREAREFATLLNSCGRNDMAELGMRICKGDRGRALDRALEMLREHRGNISNGLFFIRDIGISQREWIQHFHCADQVKETIVGSIVGILLGSGEADRSKPLIGFALAKEQSGEFKIKVSARATYELVGRGLNLSTAIRGAAQAVGGIGGGHNVAAGATLPLGKEDEFLMLLEKAVKEQLSAH